MAVTCDFVGGAVWIDVGAHLGERTLPVARANPTLKVYAFEPNLEIAARVASAAPNFLVFAMAVSEEDGFADFHTNSLSETSSLLPFDGERLRLWRGGENLAVVRTTLVPTMRLDTFLRLMGIAKVDYLKVDAQGADLLVVKSAGKRLRDIARVTLEVAVTPTPLYVGGAQRAEAIDFMELAGFFLVDCERQTRDQEENLTFERRSA